jgi:hypothetical protein
VKPGVADVQRRVELTCVAERISAAIDNLPRDRGLAANAFNVQMILVG